jgi:hypothetical protein
VYYTVVETATHWFVQYMPYHPVDYKRIGGHTHDTESVLLAVRKDGDGARLEVMETRFHRVWYQYAAGDAGVTSRADDVDGVIRFDDDGHPEVYVQRVGHGLCGGLAPTEPVRELELVCDHSRAPKLQERGIVYRYTGEAQVPIIEAPPSTQSCGYALTEIATSLWPRRSEGQTFAQKIDYRGERCDEPSWSCPRGLGKRFTIATDGEGAEAPWAQTPGRGSLMLGEQFFDPAATLARRLTFADAYSLDYAYNPYIGIGEPHR